MNDNIEMVYSSCAAWLADWLIADRPTLMDEWDLSMWMEHEMNDATTCFLEYGFKSSRGRNDALLILRALYFEYFLLQQSLHCRSLSPNPTAVARLLSVQQTTQKSASWHSESHDLLTGHEFGAVCYGTPARRNLVLAKKCAPLVVVDETVEMKHSQTVFTTSQDGSLSALKWGWRFEPVVRDLFERCIAQGSVDDTLGRIRHSTLPRLAASPDGLITNGPRCGRLLEIKAPISRDLTGEIPLDYYCQMQLQAEVCNVAAVEYVECRCEVFSITDADITVIGASKIPWIGKICVVAADESIAAADYEYIYSPLFPNTRIGLRDCSAWLPARAVIIHEASYWFVRDWFTQTVMRNQRWWTDVGYPAYVDFWKEVDEARKTGRFKPQAQFVDTSTECSRLTDGAGDVGENYRPVCEIVDESDDSASVDTQDTEASGTGVWKGDD